MPRCQRGRNTTWKTVNVVEIPRGKMTWRQAYRDTSEKLFFATKKIRHRFLGFGLYVEPVQMVRSVFFLDLCEFLRRLQYLHYVEANQSGSSPESLERENTFCTITFQKCKKKKNQLGKYTGSMRSIQKCIKIDLFPIIGSN